MNDTSEAKLHFLDYWRVIRNRWGLCVLIFLLVVITAGITTAVIPREYLSSVQIEVKQDQGMRIFDRALPSSDPRFSATQFQIIQSKEILYSVIKKLGLIESWSKANGHMSEEQAFFKLRKMLDMHDVRNTDLIEIGVYSINAQEASDIANAIADEYIRRRRVDEDFLSSSGLGELREQIDEQRKKVETSFKSLSDIRDRDKIIDPNPDQIETGGEDLDIRVVAQAELATNEEGVKVATLRTQIDQLNKLEPEQLITTLSALDINDPTILKVLPAYLESTGEVTRLESSGLGENHPRVRSIRAQRDLFLTQLTSQVESIKAALKTKLLAAEATQSALQDQLEDARRRYLGTRAMSGDYLDAKNRYLQAKKVLEASETRAETERIQRGITVIPARIWANAEVAFAPAKPNVPAYMGLAVLVGVVMGIGMAFFFEYLDTSVKTVDDVERFLGVPVLAVIPRGVTNLVATGGGDNAEAEAYRILRTNIEFSKRDPDANTITVISGGPAEGKSTTIANLAWTCANNGSNVLVVDADMRRPSQHLLFKMKNSPGLAEYFLGEFEVEEVIRRTQVEGLSFLPSGKLPHNAVGILNQSRMQRLLADLKPHYDFIFFDSPPILGVSDGAIVSSEVDLTLMVVQHRRFARSMLQRVKSSVQSAGGHLLGVVLNKVDTKKDNAGSYYGAYDRDYYAMTDEKDPIKATPATPAAPAPKAVSGRSSRTVTTPDDY